MLGSQWMSYLSTGGLLDGDEMRFVYIMTEGVVYRRWNGILSHGKSRILVGIHMIEGNDDARNSQVFATRTLLAHRTNIPVIIT